MHLTEYDEELVTHRAWTEPRHIEQQLEVLTDHIENVIQRYLRNVYATIEEYNEKAGELAEPYRVLVVFDFPTNFSEQAARRLVSIAQNGPRCGVYTIVLVDTERPRPHGFSLGDLERNATVIAWNEERQGFVWEDDDFRDCALELDTMPDDELVNRIIEGVGRAVKAAERVEVPFERVFELYAAQIEREADPWRRSIVAKPVDPADPSTWWWASAQNGLVAPLGRRGAKDVQCLELNKGTAIHGLIAGRTGSGKSTLFHSLIASVALLYSPDEVELYLIDFKEGVEFEPYAKRRLPHARVVAIESEREFGLSVLEGLEAELKRRGDLFLAKGADSLTEYRQKTGERMPRVLLLVDEFQHFFVEDDAISSRSAHLLDRLARQARSFGIHVLLSSQSLAGPHLLPQSTRDQMGVRIALQCSEADSRWILADDNPAARGLSRAGEAIYNDKNGLFEGNNKFQVAWLPDDQLDRYVDRVREHAEAQQYRPPQEQIIFEGNAAATVEKNRQLAEALVAPGDITMPRDLRAWLGDRIEIRDPLTANFSRQSGSNLLIVGQDAEAALGMFVAALVSLAAQLPAPGSAALHLRFPAHGVGAELVSAPGSEDVFPSHARVRGAGGEGLLDVLDFGATDAAGADHFERLREHAPGRVRIGRRRQLPDVIAELAAEVQRRLDDDATNAPPRFLLIYGLHRARDLRPDDGFAFSSFGQKPAAPNPSQQFATVLRDGPEVGIHTIVWCDTMTNLNRSLDRRSLREFALRVVFQMSAEDSANLIDTPAASKLGQYRALFYSEDQGRLEKFRPYGLPSAEWLQVAGECLEAKAAAPAE